MEPLSVALLAFSSVLVVGSSTMIIVVNYRRYCMTQAPPTQPVDWANVSHNVISR
jgi:hypothetical protein